MAHRLRALRGAHGGLLRGISRAPMRAIGFAHLQSRALRPGRQPSQKIVFHTAVHHGQRQPVLARQYADRRATGQKVLHHLPAHLAGKGRNTLRGDPVVSGKNHHLRLLQNRVWATQNFTQLQGQFL